jgi:two-component system chemotaxis response regulator CheY
MRALVVDDSRAMRSILKAALKNEGFEVVEAANGREALEKLREASHPELALVDWNMPEMNGIEFIGVVRSDRGLDSMRLMMVTTETEPEQVRRALDAGADEYIMKPFTRDVLHMKLQTLGLR